MALALNDRVQQTGTANTTVSFTLTGSVTGFQSFAVVGDGNTTYYSAFDGSGNWEVGLGTYSTTGPTLTRTTILSSSNSNTAVTFSGSVSIFVTYPSSKAVYEDASGNVSPLGTISSGVWQGTTVGVAYGGTGVTTSSGANSVVIRDANQNIDVNRLNQGLQTTTASGGTTVLTVASQFNQALVGTGGHTYRLPDATTLSATTAFQFNNNATGTLTIQNNALTTVGTIAPGGAAGIALLSNATVAGTWDVHAYIPENVTWGTNALNLGTTVISNGTWQGGTIGTAYGGTGLTTFAAANSALYSSSASVLVAGTLPVAAGGTGGTTAADARTNIGAGTGNGTVTSVGWTGGIVSVATATTTPAFTIAGTSGGIPYFSSGTAWASSAALAANALVVGGGAGLAPATVTTGTGVVTALGVAANGVGGFVTDTGSVTLTNKTVNLTSNTLSGTKAQFDIALSDDNFAYLGAANTFTATNTFKGVISTVFTITDAAGFEIDPANGEIQTVTLGATRTPVATNFSNGEVVLLGVDDGAGFNIIWTSIPVTWVRAGGGASAPTLASTGFTWVLLWEVGSVVYGSVVGSP